MVQGVQPWVAIRQAIPMTTGLWQRCYEYAEHNWTCTNWDTTWSHAEHNIIFKCYTSSDEYRHIDNPVAAVDIKIARRLIGTGMGMILLSILILFTKIVNRNTVFNVASIMLFMAAVFILLGTFILIGMPYQHKFLRPPLEMPQWNNPKYNSSETTSQATPTTAGTSTETTKSSSWEQQRKIALDFFFLIFFFSF